MALQMSIDQRIVVRTIYTVLLQLSCNDVLHDFIRFLEVETHLHCMTNPITPPPIPVLHDAPNKEPIEEIRNRGINTLTNLLFQLNCPGMYDIHSFIHSFTPTMAECTSHTRNANLDAR